MLYSDEIKKNENHLGKKYLPIPFGKRLMIQQVKIAAQE